MIIMMLGLAGLVVALALDIERVDRKIDDILKRMDKETKG